MRRLILAIVVAVALVGLDGPAAAQVDTVAQTQIPTGNTFAPNTPACTINFGNDIWFCDEAQGLRHCVWIGPATDDPLTNQQCQFDIDPSWSFGGGGVCIPFCAVGQAAKRTPPAALGAGGQYIVTAWQHIRGQPGQVGGGGVYSITFNGPNAFGNTGSPLGGWVPLAIGKIPGARPTSVAIGPDNNPYVGFLDSGTYGRITGVDGIDPTQGNFQTIGTSVNGKPIFAMAFYGSDLYMATGDGFYVVPNAVACTGNQNNCGLPKLVWSCAGPCNGLTTDGFGNLYFLQNSGGTLYRYTPATKASPIVVNRGFAVVAGHTNGVDVDSKNNLWIGDNPGIGTPPNPDAPNGGRLSRIKAINLPAQ
jgi:hypothetical protein